ncbi:hypothetical protein SASPL_106092 [Salvia splendens]|uniref:Protein transport Sec1a n=1 Tax=Salvia splendens TaxID=180675 RepID=A0A8X8YML1_SALSN|nr:hypothetical protein SASPL_106092 [Salvia splendens]
MPVSDSDFSRGGNWKTFRQIGAIDCYMKCFKHLNQEIRDHHGSFSQDTAIVSEMVILFKVLIMDKVTVKVMSCLCKMSDINEQGILLYHSPEFCSTTCYHFGLLGTCKFYSVQLNTLSDLTYLFIFFSIIMLLSDMSGREPLYRKAYVYFSSPVPNHLLAHIKNDSSVVPRIAALREMNLEYFSVDDQVAPIIHEWTYDAMCHDLLNLDGNRYVPEVPSKSGDMPEKKEILLEDQDPAIERLDERTKNFVSNNKAAQLQQRDGSQLSTRDLQKMVQALPQYNEQMEKLSVHVEIAGKLTKIIRDMGLRELGQLEQDLVFGDAGTNEVINFLRKNQEERSQNILRLMMIYAAVYPENFDGDKALKLMQLARLSDTDMKAVKNMTLIGGCDSRSVSRGTFSLMFDSEKRKSTVRKDRTGEEAIWDLFRFYPMIEELIEKLNKGELPKDEYHCMNNPTDPFSTTSQRTNGRAQVASIREGQSTATHSMRSRRTATWARSRFSDDGSSNDLVLNTVPVKKMGQRIFVFIIGGVTRSELRICHKLTTKLRREVILGSTSFDDPAQYIECRHTTHVINLSSYQIRRFQLVILRYEAILGSLYKYNLQNSPI